MKTDKEYPATHSMSTAWFAVDAEGNVAILDYDDNGPVPVFVPDTAEDEIICDDFATRIPGEPFQRWSFSEEEFERILASPSAYEFELEEGQDDIYSAVVRVDMSRFDEFLEAARLFEGYSTICVNLEKGLFFLDWWGYENNKSQAVRNALNSGLVTPIKHLTFDNWEADPDILSSYPFFVYRQDYDCSKLIERTVIPEKPFKDYRLPVPAQKNAIRLPFKFKDTPVFQMARYEFSNVSFFQDELINGRIYHKMPIGDGKEAHLAYSSMYHAGCGFICRKCYHEGAILHDTYAYQGCKYPTVAVIKDLKELHYQYVHSVDVIFRHSVFLPILQGLADPHRRIDGPETREHFEDPMGWRFSRCHKNLEKNIDFFRPHVLLLYKSVIPLLEKYYTFQNGKIRIGRRKYPYFLWEELENHRSEIEALAMKPYRGDTVPFMIPAEDIDEKEIRIYEYPWW